MHKRLSPGLSICTFLLTCLTAFTLSAQSPNMTVFDPQKVMHIENYEPIPGDTYTLAIDYGGRDRNAVSYPIVLQEDYILELPYLGSFSARGMNFAQLRSTIVGKIRSIVPLQYISFTLTSPSKFDVFIYGKVKNTGYITVNSLSRLSDALLAAGGQNGFSSMRTIEITRKNVKSVYDMKSYEMLGKPEQNPQLRPGDRIFVPQVKQSVILAGAVTFPGEYEFLPGETLGSILLNAGGMTSTAFPGGFRVLRLGEKNQYSVSRETVDPEKFVLQHGDRITVESTLENVDIVTVEGAIFGAPIKDNTLQPVPAAAQRLRVPYHPGFSLLELLETIGGPTPFAENGRAYLIRGGTGTRTALPALAELWERKDRSKDMLLEPGDYLVIPVKKMKVFIAGEVFGPGAYDYVEGFTVGDYVTMAGGVKPETGSQDGIYRIDELGKKVEAGIASPVSPGDRYVVEQNTWGKTQLTFRNFVTVAGWVTTLTGVILAVKEIYDTFR